MTPDRLERLRRILRLATLLGDDERESYVTAVTQGDDEMRRAVDHYLATHVNEEQTLQARAWGRMSGEAPDVPHS